SCQAADYLHATVRPGDVANSNTAVSSPDNSARRPTKARSCPLHSSGLTCGSSLPYPTHTPRADRTKQAHNNQEQVHRCQRPIASCEACGQVSVSGKPIEQRQPKRKERPKYQLVAQQPAALPTLHNSPEPDHQPGPHEHPAFSRGASSESHGDQS